MQAHHTLMVKHDDDGNVVDHKAIPNNEWAKYRRSGWEFATTDEQSAHTAAAVERAEAAAELAKENASEETDSGDGPLAKKKAPAKKKR